MTRPSHFQVRQLCQNCLAPFWKGVSLKGKDLLSWERIVFLQDISHSRRVSYTKKAYNKNTSFLLFEKSPFETKQKVFSNWGVPIQLNDRVYARIVYSRKYSKTSTQQTHNVPTTSLQRRCNVVTLQSRCNDVVPTLFVCWVIRTLNAHLPCFKLVFSHSKILLMAQEKRIFRDNLEIFS